MSEKKLDDTHGTDEFIKECNKGMSWKNVWIDFLGGNIGKVFSDIRYRVSHMWSEKEK